MTDTQLAPSGAATEVAERRFAAFVVSHRAWAVRVAWRLCGGDAGAAEDVAQEAFVRAWRALDGFREDAALSTWFHRILVRQALNHHRARVVRQRLAQWFGGLIDPSAPAPDPDRGLARRIGAAVEALPGRQRAAFVLVHLEERPLADAAAALGPSVGTVKVHLHRARQRLRESLGDLAPDANEEGAR